MTRALVILCSASITFAIVRDVCMKTAMRLAALAVCISCVTTVGSGQLPDKDSAYPNELPCLKNYERSRWKTVRPLVSTAEDIQKLLEKPVAVYDEFLRSYIAGYQDDPDWVIVFSLVDKNSELMDSVIGTVFSVELLNFIPKKTYRSWE